MHCEIFHQWGAKRLIEHTKKIISSKKTHKRRKHSTVTLSEDFKPLVLKCHQFEGRQEMKSS